MLPGLMALLLGLVALLPACGGKSVKGSLSVLMDMTYRDIDIVLGSSDATVRFTRPPGEDGLGEDLVLAVSARALRLPFAPDAGTPGLSFDLAEDIGGGVQRGSLARNVLNDPRRTFPAILRGHLNFVNVPAAGQPTAGDFSVTFVLGEEFGDGRTLFDSFQGMVR
jgi:hypothetical protein